MYKKMKAVYKQSKVNLWRVKRKLMSVFWLDTMRTRRDSSCSPVAADYGASETVHMPFCVL